MQTVSVRQANAPAETPCPNCDTTTALRYIVIFNGTPSGSHTGCNHCIDSMLNETNDGLYGESEWIANNKPQLTKPELITLIETEYIRYGRSIPKTANTFNSHPIHLEFAEEATNNGKLDTTTVADDENIAFWPSASRRYELMQIYDLENDWELGQKRIEILKDKIKEDLGKDPFNN